MSSVLQQREQEPLFDSELKEWLLFKDDSEEDISEPLLKLHTSLATEELFYEYLEGKENAYWLEEFPLFEEIQPVEEGKILQDEPSPVEKSDDEKLAFDQNAATSDFPADSNSLQDLFATSLENTTFVFSNENVVYLKSEPHLDIGFIPKGDLKSNSLQNHIPSNSVETADGSESEIKREMAVLDELLRNAALELDASTSEISSDGHPASGSSSTQEDESDDPEWKPTCIKQTTSRRQCTKPSKLLCGPRSQQDKWLRKKEQNKTAATRYRLKKKAEVSETLRVEEELKKKKATLEGKVFDLQNEIKCLKGLMRDLFRAKGLIT